jgi:hypothetical protein
VIRVGGGNTIDSDNSSVTKNTFTKVSSRKSALSAERSIDGDHNNDIVKETVIRKSSESTDESVVSRVIKLLRKQINRTVINQRQQQLDSMVWII